MWLTERVNMIVNKMSVSITRNSAASQRLTCGSVADNIVNDHFSLWQTTGAEEAA